MALRTVVQPSSGSRTDAARWVVGIGTVALLLALVAYAEAVWLHDALPQDRVSRVVLVAFPAAPAGVGGDQAQTSLAPDWGKRLVQGATDVELLKTLGARLAAGSDSGGWSLSAEQLREQMTVTSQCIVRTSPQGRPVQGVMLVNTVRAAKAAEVETMAGAWSALVMETSAGRYPGLIVQPVESLGAAYELCR